MTRLLDAAKMAETLREELLLLDRVQDVTHIGSSRYWEQYADVDLLVLIEGEVTSWRRSDGDVLCSGEYAFLPEASGGHMQWKALRNGDVNLIVTNDLLFYARYLNADEVCRALELPHKYQRVIVHRVLRDGMTWQEAQDEADLYMRNLACKTQPTA